MDHSTVWHQNGDYMRMLERHIFVLRADKCKEGRRHRFPLVVASRRLGGMSNAGTSPRKMQRNLRTSVCPCCNGWMGLYCTAEQQTEQDVLGSFSLC
eukprot:s3839_g5.t1